LLRSRVVAPVHRAGQILAAALGNADQKRVAEAARRAVEECAVERGQVAVHGKRGLVTAVDQVEFGRRQGVAIGPAETPALGMNPSALSANVLERLADQTR